MIKVLVVDDDEDLLEMVTLMLTASNMEVESLNKGGSLFRTIEACKPDALLMDVYLGDTDGRELCKHLKLSIRYTGFPVFLYSAGDITSASFIESGADFFFRKPFDMSQLLKHIQDRVRK